VPRIAILTIFVLLVTAAPAFAHDAGEGWWGITNDKVVTNFGYALIAFFPLFVFTASMIQGRLDKKKAARKKAAKGRANAAEWHGGW
jgi:hypothetical protein